MKKSNSIILFNKKQVRRIWNEGKELWYFSIIDIVAILTDSPRPRKYWNALKTKLKQEGSESSQKVGQLKLESPDGKRNLDLLKDTVNSHLNKFNGKEAEKLKIEFDWLDGKRYTALSDVIFVVKE